MSVLNKLSVEITQYQPSPVKLILCVLRYLCTQIFVYSDITANHPIGLNAACDWPTAAAVCGGSSDFRCHFSTVLVSVHVKGSGVGTGVILF